MTTTRLLRVLLLCPLLMLIMQQSWAQNKTVSGKVSDDKGNPVAGASVTVKGSKQGTATDAAGSFKLTVASSATTLVVSSVGFSPTEVSIGSGEGLSVVLTTVSANLNEVIVVGYGTRKAKDATGSVASITTKDFNKGVISSPEQLIQGRTPGVTITPASGEPGAAATINIRGSASIRGSQEPLYVVDGVPVTSGGTLGTASGVEGSSTPKNPLIFLNPNDIESITILKDASSAAIYGSRGANGVVLITTKHGKGGSSLQFGSATSISNVASKYDLLNREDFLEGVVDANVLAGIPEGDARENVKVLDKGANTDWQDQIYRTGISQNYNLSWSVGGKSTSVRLSGSYDDQKGIIKNTGLKRMTGRANFSQKFFEDKLRLDVDFTYSNTKNQYPPLTNNAGYQGSLIGAVISFNPTYPIYDSTGLFYDPGDGNRNPAQMLAYFDDKDNIDRYLGNASITYKIVEGLSYKAVFGLDRTSGRRLSFADPRLKTGAFGGTNSIFGVNLNNPIQGNGRASSQVQDLKSYLVEHYITWDKNFNGGHNINAVAGYSYQSFESNYRNTIAWGTNNSVTKSTDIFVKDFNSFKNYYMDIPYFSKSELQSFFGRINYTLGEKYFLTATFRADGSSKFGQNNRYGYFPAFAAKWRILKEEFAQKSLGKIFNDLSIRANYGILGSQDGIGAYDALNLQTTYIGNSGEYETSFNYFGNPNLKWEQSTTTGVGIDFSMFNSRLSGTVDYYFTRRKDLLFYSPTPGGFAPTANWFINLPGYVVNSGLEFSFNFAAVKGNKFKWDINYNMTFQKNKMTDFPLIVPTGEVSGQGLSGAYAQTIQNDYSLFTWKMLVFEGYDKDGFAIYGNGANDALLGSALPKFNAGLTNTFTYGRVSASVFLNAVTGFYIYNNTANALLLKGSLKNGRNVTYAAANSPENPINPGSVSTRFLEKGDFLRIANANIAYAFNIKNNKSVKTLSVYASAQNLALFTNYSGLDPEVNVDKNISGIPSRGFDYTGYPKARTFTFGLNVGF